MHISSLVLALVAVASSPKEVPLPVRCAAPSPRTSLAVHPLKTETIEWVATASGGVTTLVATIPLSPDATLPSEVAIAVDTGPDQAILVDANLVHNGVTQSTTPQTPTVARQEFETFHDAITRGSEPGSIVTAGRPSGAVIAEVDEHRARTMVRAVLPCVDGLTASTRIELKFRSLGLPVPDGWQVYAPSLYNDVNTVDPHETLRLQSTTLWAPSSGRLRVGSGRVRRETLGPDDSQRVLFVRASEVERIEAGGADVFFPSEGGGITATTASLRLPSPLTTAGPRQHLIFVVDKSVSVGRERQRAAWAFAAGVVEKAGPTARYSVVEFGRQARIGRTHEASTAYLRTNARFAEEENGSALVDALKLARVLASDLDPDVTTRLIVFSDTTLGPLLSALQIEKELARANVVTHKVQFEDGTAAAHVDHLEVAFERVFGDRSVVARGLAATGGIEVYVLPTQVDAGGDEQELAEARRRSGGLLLRHLVSPQLIDRLQLRPTRGAEGIAEHFGVNSILDNRHRTEPGESRYGVRVDAVSTSFPNTLAAGEHLQVVAGIRGKVSTSTFYGELWADPVAVDVSRSAAAARVVPGVVATRFEAVLTDAEGEMLSRHSGAVSSFLSRVGIPKWRPPVVESFALSGCASGSSCCCGGFGRRSSCRGIRSATTNNQEKRLLEAALQAAITRCDAPVETTVTVAYELQEVLAVEANVPAKTPAAKAKARCTEEEFWALRLATLQETYASILPSEGESDEVSSLPSQFQSSQILTVTGPQGEIVE